MNQALYAHMNNKRKMKKKKRNLEKKKCPLPGGNLCLTAGGGAYSHMLCGQ
jgi:hypothetical protein